jgi:hypothetical protein
MKLPEYFSKESSHKVDALNTLSLTGLSLLWGVMLELISPWWLTLSILFILSGYGSEIEKRKGEDTLNV